MSTLTAHGKQVLRNGQPYADAATPEAAAEIVAAANQRAGIAAYIDAEADRRTRWLATGLRIIASNIRAHLDEKDEPTDV